MNKRIILKVALILFLGLLVTTENFAHSGRTDSNGGHYDRSTGIYHYHNGGATQYSDDEEIQDTEINFTNTTDYTWQIESLKTQVEYLEETVRKKESSIEELETELEEKTNEVYDLENEKYALIVWFFIMGIVIAIILYRIGKSKNN